MSGDTREFDEKDRNDWIITIIQHSTTAYASVEPALDQVVDILKEQGLELDRIVALSPVQPGGSIETHASHSVGDSEHFSTYSCAEVWFYGHIDDETRLRAEYRSLADTIAVDIVLQQESPSRRNRRLFCFDMDSTLIQGEVIDELAKLAGVGDQVVEITAAAMRGEIEFQESFRRRVALLHGLPEAGVYELLERIPLMHGAERLFRTLHQLGATTAILSGGFTFFGRHLQQKLGIDHLHANTLHLADGFVTGHTSSLASDQVPSPIIDGPRKAALLVEIARSAGIPLDQVVAVGDGANDLPMLRLAGLGVAFHAKPLVRASAAHSMTHSGLDALLYLLGIPDRDWA